MIKSLSNDKNGEGLTLAPCGTPDVMRDVVDDHNIMPYKYIRRTTRASWSENNILKAIRAVQNGISIRKAAKLFSVPYTTIYDRLKKPIPDGTKKLGRNTIFTAQQEKELADYIIKMSKLFFGLSRLHVRRIAFEYAEKNEIPNDFNKQKRLCGKDWYYGFLKRHESEYEKYKFDPRRIYNVDETGITPVHIPGRVLAAKGQKQVGAVTSGERGKLITVVCAMNAAGDYIPPMFIFARQRMNPELTKNGPTNALYKISKNGWITDELFFDWIQHFAKHIKASIEERTLLILDNQSSHCTLRTYNFCRERGISIITLPPHTSHRLQPLDVCFYGPLKSAYNIECDNLLRSNNYEKIRQSDVAELFKKAYNRTATIDKAVRAFECTGIHPLNRNVISEEELAPYKDLQPSHNMALPSAVAGPSRIRNKIQTSKVAASSDSQWRNILFPKIKMAITF
ncbi:hypothetical protein NQ318_000559 [Aromia moschata]|uniref:Transposase n=1 Tax=Aromia moschata TaxID=1265417 RepID=A0AAV8XXW2_9CUCU|nr:hypothetical protein NQ318_000559 [Aromia moschata]